MHKQAMFLIGALALSTTLAQAQPNTDQDRACRSDATRHCRKVLDKGDDAVLQCLKSNERKLRPACRAMINGR